MKQKEVNYTRASAHNRAVMGFVGLVILLFLEQYLIAVFVSLLAGYAYGISKSGTIVFRKSRKELQKSSEKNLEELFSSLPTQKKRLKVAKK